MIQNQKTASIHFLNYGRLFRIQRKFNFFPLGSTVCLGITKDQLIDFSVRKLLVARILERNARHEAARTRSNNKFVLTKYQSGNLDSSLTQLTAPPHDVRQTNHRLLANDAAGAAVAGSSESVERLHVSRAQ